MRAGHVGLGLGRLPVSARVSVRTVSLLALVFGLVASVATWAMTLGDFPLSVGEVVELSSEPRAVPPISS